MSDGTHIEWTDATWNPITGCSLVSPGCTNCYAMRLAGTRLKHIPSREGLTHETKAGPVWTGEVRFNRQWVLQPMSWRRPRRIFVCAHGDLFAEGVEDSWLDEIFRTIGTADWHTFQVLTKRPDRMRDYIGKVVAWGELRAKDASLEGARAKMRDWVVAGMPNLWLGVSVEDQRRADERIPLLLDTPAAVRFISAEPLLGPIDLTDLKPDQLTFINAVGGARTLFDDESDKADSEGGTLVVGAERLDWVIVGGESGKGSRPMHPDWARSLRDQCAAADVPFFFKQWGEFAPYLYAQVDDVTGSGAPDVAWPDGSIAWGTAAQHGGMGTLLHPVGKRAAGRMLDRIEHNGMPAHG